MNARLRLALMVLSSLVILAAGGIVLFAGRDGGDPALGADGFAGATSPAVPPMDFRLRDEEGRMVSLADYRGRVTMLTFMYSTCQDTCPVTATQIRMALDDLGHDVPTLAVSVDPRNDTPDNVQAFLVKRGLSNGRMHFLTGTPAQLRRIWKAYGIAPQGKHFDHSARVLLIDRRGRQRVSFPVAQLTPEGLVNDLRKLEAEA